MLGAAAAGATALFAAGTGRATASPSHPPSPRAWNARAPIPDGAYTISRPREQLLTLSESHGPVVVLRPIGQPGVQEWHVGSLPNGNVTLRNLRQGSYAGYHGHPAVNTPIVGRTEPTQWALRQSSESFTFHVVVPGGPVDGVELVLDLSLLLIYPPHTALRPWRPHDHNQAWRFRFHE